MVIHGGLFFSKNCDEDTHPWRVNFVLGLQMTLTAWIQYDTSHYERITHLPVTGFRILSKARIDFNEQCIFFFFCCCC